jgi:cysteine desulfurase / selenocysteine lyase
VRVHQIPYAQVAEAPGEALEAVLSDRTRLLAISHVTTNVGNRFPVAELCDTARRHGVPSFLELGHSAGVVPLELDALGCDFAGVLSYKWMYSPYASGVLYVREHSLDRLALRFAGNRSERRLDPETNRFELHEDARRFEFGPWSWPIVHSWAASVTYLEGLGRDAIWRHTQRLTGRLRDALSEVGGVRVLTPPDAAALVTFELAGMDAAEAARRLEAEHGIRVKGLPNMRGCLRASIAVFSSDDDVDALAVGVGALVGSRI